MLVVVLVTDESGQPVPGVGLASYRVAIDPISLDPPTFSFELGCRSIVVEAPDGYRLIKDPQVEDGAGRTERLWFCPPDMQNPAPLTYTVYPIP
jgi:hypothetical protein